MSVSSPDSPARHAPLRPISVEYNSLRPSSVAASRTSVPTQLMSPSDLVGPSPVTSVGTEATEIEDDMSDEVRSQSNATNPEAHPQLLMLRTNIPDQLRQNASDEAVSVIHAPESFQSWNASDTTLKQSPSSQRTSPKTSPRPDNITVPPARDHNSKAKSPGLPTPPPLTTDIKPVRYSVDSATPRAQNLQDVQSLLSESARIRSSSTSSLELIPETREPETDVEPDLESYDDDHYVTPVRGEVREDEEIVSLQTALQECWTLCNTLATLSTHHRERVFSTSGTPDGHEKAWKCCWKLCQRLYDSRDEADEPLNVKINLDLCRDFCQSLFDVRTRQDEIADSVLRVSFELNNHLYSAQDNRNLPEAFRERTLDFYITLCHRLMKQRGELAEETSSLLRACWSLAEMLFSIRQNKRDGKAPDEELLGSAVQACWELCDIFREGWTQIRPDRGTPRPSQTNFFTYNREVDTDGRASRQSNRSKKRDSADKPRKPPPVPETPVTEFEDTPISPDSESPQVPNILVLGTDSNRGGRWSSSASNLSGYSQSSQRTSSTATTATSAEDLNVTRVKALILKAALNVGYSRDGGSDGHSNAASLQAFVKSLPTGSFGSLPTHATLLQNYKNLVVADSSFRQASSLPSRGKRVLATDVGKSVSWMISRSGQYGFLRDLFKLVFGFHLEEAEARKNVSIAV
ncbi:Uu.00g028330.m01.CDS01 [Anthostomella pinea]|uniref:Uu.00g028330.m01.CDS01 n=1 Tax=Anthostomella pinea TaxID=933095 RepID=A0AAI8YCR2_9PEZI|nr:Uu.00g028330.m01.CDS01 [Anthostomella pinea]